MCFWTNSPALSEPQRAYRGSPQRFRFSARWLADIRFRCEATHCQRQIFAERFAAAVLPTLARRTTGLECLVHHLGLALGGPPAASFATRLMLPVSNDTLLRVMRRRASTKLSPASARLLLFVDESPINQTVTRSRYKRVDGRSGIKAPAPNDGTFVMAYDFSAVSVLVVDDHEYMRRLLASVLKALSFGHVDVAEDARDASNKLRLHMPEIVITDYLMEPMDGIEFVRQIRTDPDVPNPFVPVLMITGFAEQSRVASARSAGVTEFLAKPFTLATLCSRLSYLVEQPRDFVRTATYFGPDRRRHDSGGYIGPERRKNAGAEHIIKHPDLGDYRICNVRSSEVSRFRPAA